MNTEGLGLFLVELGGGRKKVTDTIDYGVGMLFHKKLGAKVAIGEPIATLYLPQGLDQTTATKNFLNCITITGTRKAPPKLVLETLG
jgi:thymidine phosphorylase